MSVKVFIVLSMVTHLRAQLTRPLESSAGFALLPIAAPCRNPAEGHNCLCGSLIHSREPIAEGMPPSARKNGGELMTRVLLVGYDPETGIFLTLLCRQE